MIRKKNYRVWFYFTISIFASLTITSIYHGMVKGYPIYRLVADAVLSGIVAYLFDHHVKKEQLIRNRRFQDKTFFSIVFLLSVLLMGVGGQDKIGYLWLLPVVMVAISSGFNQSVSVFVVLILQYLLLYSDSLDVRSFVLMFVYSALCIWFLSQPNLWEHLPYLLLILLAMEGVLQIIHYEFMLKEIVLHKKEVCIEVFSILVIELFLIAYSLYRKFSGRENEEARLRWRDAQDKLIQAMEADFGLLLRLQEYSGELFMHSMKVSTISEQAARHLGADAMLSKAGGMYHEIGRITGDKNYIDSGIRLLNSYNMPEELVDIVKQHSTGADKPKSAEAAIVMMTDCIISTNDILVKSGKREKISDEKLVNTVFQNRIDKGDLAQCGMSKHQLDRLLKFYKKQIFMTEVK